MGGTLLVHQALTNGEIDVYPEYTGTAMSAVLKLNMVHDAQTIRERVREVYRTTFAVEWLDPLGFNDSFAMIIRKSDADALGLETLSDATKVKSGWTLGEGYEFQERPDGFAMLNGSYNLPMKGAPVTMDLGLLYKALEQKQVNMIAGNTTDGLLDASKVKMLVDDRKAFPPYEACLLVRTEALATNPNLRAVLNELTGKFSDETMRRLNREVDLNHSPVPEVAAGFLRQAGLAQ
jgi:glycine betaine/choline ABC-type transport system substrate-binding protein